MRTIASTVIVEALLVMTLGLAVALAANFVSPRGLSLARDYFPAKEITAPATMMPDARESDAVDSITWQTISTKETEALFRDQEYEDGMIVFIDARDDRHYETGHIPGAFQLDRYYPENHLPTVLPACMNAARVVVYYTGGDCEDSHFAAQLLVDAGVSLESISIYAGGITEWSAARLPVETGARNSGEIVNHRNGN